MKLEKEFIVVLICTVFSLICHGQSDIIIPSGFIKTIPPKYGSNEWYSLNRSRNEFTVKNVEGQLEIGKYNPINECEIEIQNGLIIGIDRGEWGGQLLYKSSDTTLAVREIKKGNVKFIFNYKNKIYFIEGLAHLTSSTGALYELDINDFTFEKLIDFDDTPEAFAIYQDKFLIATHKNFFIVEDFKKELILKNTFWSGLYPNSIAVFDDKNVFIGIRGGMVKINLITKTMIFYKNNE